MADNADNPPALEFLPLPDMPGISADFKKKIGNLFLKVNILRHFLAPVARNRESLSRFGLKTSTTLRAHFYRVANAFGLTPEATLWVYLFCAKARTKDRIKAGIKTLPATLTTSDPHFKSAARFLETRMVTWPDQETEEKFATVHLPNTNPGLAFLMVVVTDPNITIEEFLRNTWAPQIHWHRDFVSTVEREAKHFWTSVVTHTTHAARRTRRPEESRFNEGIFETQLKDEYPLFKFNEDGELEPFKTGGPYTSDDLKEYLAWAKSLDSKMEELGRTQPPGGPGGPGGAGKRPGGTDDSDDSPSKKSKENLAARPSISTDTAQPDADMRDVDESVLEENLGEGSSGQSLPLPLKTPQAPAPTITQTPSNQSNKGKKK